MSILSGVELVMWSPAKDAEPPSVVQVRDALVAHGFQRDRAADIANSSAFRRAVKERETDEKKATCWQKDGRTHAQLDRLVSEGIEGERLRREFVAHWCLTGDKVSGSEPLELRRHLETYTWADLTKVVKEILDQDGLGAYTPRKAGGIYFCPFAGRDVLDRLERACRAVGLSLLRYEVPDSAAQRNEVQATVVAGIGAEIDAHAAAVESYTVETREHAIAGRRESLANTRSLIGRLAGHLGDAVPWLNSQLDELDALCVQLEQAIATAAQHAQRAGARRVVSMGVGG